MTSPHRRVFSRGRKPLHNQSELISMGPVKRLAETDDLLNLQIDSLLTQQRQSSGPNASTPTATKEPQFLSLFPTRDGFASSAEADAEEGIHATKGSTEAYRVKGAVPVDDRDFERKVQRGMVSLNEVTTPEEVVFLPTETLRRGLMRVDAINSGRASASPSSVTQASKGLDNRDGGHAGSGGVSNSLARQGVKPQQNSVKPMTLAHLTRAPGGAAFVRYFNKKERQMRPDLVRGDVAMGSPPSHQLPPLQTRQMDGSSAPQQPITTEGGTRQPAPNSKRASTASSQHSRKPVSPTNDIRAALPNEIANEAEFLAKHRAILTRLEESMNATRPKTTDRVQQQESSGISTGAVVAAGLAVAAMHRVEELVGERVTITCFINEAITSHFASIVTRDHAAVSSRPKEMTTARSTSPDHSPLTSGHVTTTTTTGGGGVESISASNNGTHGYLPQSVRDSLQHHLRTHRIPDVPESVFDSDDGMDDCENARRRLTVGSSSPLGKNPLLQPICVVDTEGFFRGIDESLGLLAETIFATKEEREEASKDRVQAALVSMCGNGAAAALKQRPSGSSVAQTTNYPSQHQPFDEALPQHTKVVITVASNATADDVISAVLARYIETRVSSGVFRHPPTFDESSTAEGSRLENVPIGHLVFEESSPFLALTRRPRQASHRDTVASRYPRLFPASPVIESDSGATAVSNDFAHLSYPPIHFVDPAWAPLVLLSAFATLYVAHPVTGEPMEELRRVVPLTSSWASPPPSSLPTLKAAVVEVQQEHNIGFSSSRSSSSSDSEIDKAPGRQRRRTERPPKVTSQKVVVPLVKFVERFGITEEELGRALQGISHLTKRQATRLKEVAVRIGSVSVVDAPKLDRAGILQTISSACSPESLKALRKSQLEPFSLTGEVEVVTAVLLRDNVEGNDSRGDLSPVISSRKVALVRAASSPSSRTTQQSSPDLVSFFVEQARCVQNVLSRTTLKVLLTTPTLCTRLEGALKQTPAGELHRSVRDRMLSFSGKKNNFLGQLSSPQIRRGGGGGGVSFQNTRLVIQNHQSPPGTTLGKPNECDESDGSLQTPNSSDAEVDDEGNGGDKAIPPAEEIYAMIRQYGGGSAAAVASSTSPQQRQRLAHLVTVPSSRPILKSILKKYLNLFQDVLRLEDTVEAERQEQIAASEAAAMAADEARGVKPSKRRRSTAAHKGETRGASLVPTSSGATGDVTKHPKFTLPDIMTALHPPYTLCVDISPSLEALIALQHAEIKHRSLIEDDCYLNRYCGAYARPYASTFLNRETILRQGLFQVALYEYRNSLATWFEESKQQAKRNELHRREFEGRQCISEEFWESIVVNMEPLYERLVMCLLFENAVVTNVLKAEILARRALGGDKVDLPSPATLQHDNQLVHLQARALCESAAAMGIVDVPNPYEDTHRGKLRVTALFEEYQRDVVAWAIEAIKEGDRSKLQAQNDLVTRLARTRASWQ